MEVPVRVLFVTRALLPPPVGGLKSGGERWRRVQRGRRWEERGGLQLVITRRFSSFRSNSLFVG